MRIVAALCAALLTAGCSGAPQTTPPPSTAAGPDPAVVVVRDLLLPDEVMTAHGLVKKGEPVEGVQKLIDCPDLPSADQAAAGLTTTWGQADGGTYVTFTQYNAVYRGITGREVVKQARAASGCHPAWEENGNSSDRDVYWYSGTDMGPTKPFVDDRFSYCVTNFPRDHSTCTSLQAEGDKVIRTTTEYTGSLEGSGKPITLRMVAQAVTDRLVA